MNVKTTCKKNTINGALLTMIFLFLANFGAQSQSKAESYQAVNIIPRPAQVVVTDGYFNIDAKTGIKVEPGNEEASRIAYMLADKFRTAAGLSLKVSDITDAKPSAHTIVFTFRDAGGELGEEGYQLLVNKENVIIRASQPAGLFYGMQTLLQLLPPSIEGDQRDNSVTTWSVPLVTILDKPRYHWRGLHLDVCRHMMPVAFVKKYIDNIAMHKLNVFHWHLTEDQGWRIEIKKYPKLTSVGAWRKETLVGHAGSTPKKFDGKRYGGFYTQEEVRDVVRYAQERFITVVPEIEMPGHSTAAIAAYPWLGVTGKPVDVATEWGVFPDIYNVSDSTFTFLEDVLTEVISLFPSKYIHIGGDEAVKDQWKTSPKTHEKIKALGLKNEHELQSYFIQRIEKFVNSKGRQIIGWDEILEGGLAPNAAVMSWRGEKGGIAAAKNGHYVVMSPGSHLYFDHYQGDPSVEPLAFGGLTTLEKVYSYEPTPGELTGEEAHYIMGLQANVWTEYIPTTAQVEYMVFPRISALSEVAWSTKESRNWLDFENRIPTQLLRYDHRGIGYSKSIYRVIVKQEQTAGTQQTQVKMESQVGGTEIHFTVDGTMPTAASPTYRQPISLEGSGMIKAGVFIGGKLKGPLTETNLSKSN